MFFLILHTSVHEKVVFANTSRLMSCPKDTSVMKFAVGSGVTDKKSEIYSPERL